MIKFDQDKKYTYIWNQRVKIYKNHYRKLKNLIASFKKKLNQKANIGLIHPSYGCNINFTRNFECRAQKKEWEERKKMRMPIIDSL
ncbi:hypothetical protein BpHYR1_030530 [Brachionus plicatilis]|uniref:Uncharacterized protein n=1 Tax=Brachionus plicatilis TaxID=10195 RepID=A0A3M7S0Y6_BRAPC|nr:hypothetical protein BpHYR1_030530 [Brachionus plicatilis]